jgi:hypothetical protein
MTAHMTEETSYQQIRETWIKRYPLTWHAFNRRRLILPEAIAADYVSMSDASEDAFIRYCSFKQAAIRETRTPPQERDNLETDIAIREFANLEQWLAGGRKTLFLERDLGLALLRTQLPEEMTFGDIHFKWPSFLVHFPFGLLPIQAVRGLEYITSVYITQLPEDGMLTELSEIHDEWRPYTNGGRCQFQFSGGLSIFAFMHHLNRMDQDNGCKLVTPKNEDLHNLMQMFTRPPDDERILPTEQNALAQAQKLTLNILLFLSSLPGNEVEPKPVRKFQMLGKQRFRSELVPASWIGRQNWKPNQPHSEKEPGSISDYRLPAHWRAGHWKRQAYGPRFSLRKPIWIEPYSTGGL